LADIPEHLLKRAAERRAALEAKQAEESADVAAPAEPETPAAEESGDTSKIPASLLARSQAARAKAQAGGGGDGEGGSGGEGQSGEGGGAVATIERPAGAATGGRAAAPVAGLGGHTQRLLTVVKAGSIQDVKAVPTDKVNVWPHLLVIEFAASLAMTAFLTIFSIFVNAPLLQLANPNLTPNPSKAPWYFLGLQEMLTMFHPMVAGVTIPGIALGVLGAAGYIDKNPSHKPEDRKFIIALFTIFMMFWAVLVLIGSFFRGEGQNFILPWRQGVHEIFDL
jgi:menaquinol-cytochrome c reductase cytochrome b/c subunit